MTMAMEDYLAQGGRLTSSQPLAEVFRAILPREERHAELGRAGLVQLVRDDAGAVRIALAYWHPRVAVGFGIAAMPRFWTTGRRP